MSLKFLPNKKYALCGIGLFLAAIVVSSIVVYLTCTSAPSVALAVALNVCAVSLLGASAGCAIMWLQSKDFQVNEKTKLALMLRGQPGDLPQARRV